MEITHKMQPQATSHILMIRPVRFGFNEETAESNAFQNAEIAANTKDIAQQDALEQFDNMVAQLRVSGIDVLVYEDMEEPHKPDSIFPNNWVSFHQSGKIVLYPMQAANRRLERRMDIIEDLKNTFQVEQIIDLTHGISFYDEVSRFEIELIRQALDLTGGHQSRAAKLLGLNNTTLNSKIKSYNIKV